MSTTNQFLICLWVPDVWAGSPESGWVVIDYASYGDYIVSRTEQGAGNADNADRGYGQGAGNADRGYGDEQRVRDPAA